MTSDWREQHVGPRPPPASSRGQQQQQQQRQQATATAMSLADELDALGGGGGRSKRRGGARRQQRNLSDDEDQFELTDAPHPTLINNDNGGGGGLGGAGESLAAELEDLAGSSRRSKRSTANLKTLDSGRDAADDPNAADDAELFGGSSTDSANSRAIGGGATYVQQADPLSDPSATPGSAEAQLDNTTEHTCSALSDVLSSTEAFLARLRKLTTTESGMPTSATVVNFNAIGTGSAPTAAGAGGTADDTARLEGYAAALLRSLRETAAQREQQVRDLREVDRHMARAEATDPDFLAKLAEADDRLDAEAEDAEAEAGNSSFSSSVGTADGQTQTWAEAQRQRRRQDSTASTDTERPPPQVVPRISSEPFSSEVTETLATMLLRNATDIDVEEGGEGFGEDDAASDEEGEHGDDHYAGAGDDLLEDGAGEDELGPGWDDPTYRGANRRGSTRAGQRDGSTAEPGASSRGAIGDVSLASTSASTSSKPPPTLPSLRTSSTLLIHSLSSLHETAQVHRATISSAERRLRGLRLLLDGWKEEIVAARRSRAWIAKWEGRDPERDDLLMDDGSGKVDEVLAASLAAGSLGSSNSNSSSDGSGRYTAGSGVTPGAYAREQMSRFQHLLGVAEERAQALLTPLPLPRINPAAA
ncbi:hypothetical protein CF328_g2060 [Tilletia controversa]|nr:hypothetical protein CF328_g2060 [Tilletia controversa]